MTGIDMSAGSETAEASPPELSYLALFLRFLRFGALAFGGPVAQIAEREKPEIPLYFENLDAARIDALLDALAEGRVPTELGN